MMDSLALVKSLFRSLDRRCPFGRGLNMQGKYRSCRLAVLIGTVLLGLTPAFAGGAKLQIFVMVVPVAQVSSPVTESPRSWSVGATLTGLSKVQPSMRQTRKLRDSICSVQIAPTASHVVGPSTAKTSLMNPGGPEPFNLDDADLVTEVVTVQ